MSPKTLLFDLDGTLTDPRPGIVGSIQYALARLNRPIPAEEDLLWCIGPPLRESFVTLLDGDALADQAVALYRERFGDVGLFENSLYPDILAVLEGLRDTGHRLFVATSKAEVFAVRIVEHFGLDGYVERVFGAKLSGERADKSDLLAFVLDETGTDADQALMIGDRSHDMVGARNNGIDGVGVLYGYGTLDELVAAGAVAVVDSPVELGGLADLI